VGLGFEKVLNELALEELEECGGKPRVV